MNQEQQKKQAEAIIEKHLRPVMDGKIFYTFDQLKKSNEWAILITIVTEALQSQQVTEGKVVYESEGMIEADNIVAELFEVLHYNVWPYLRAHDAEQIRKDVVKLITKLEKLAK